MSINHLAAVTRSTATLTFVLPPSSRNVPRFDLLRAMEDREIRYDLFAHDEDHGGGSTLTVRLTGTGQEVVAKIASVVDGPPARQHAWRILHP